MKFLCIKYEEEPRDLCGKALYNCGINITSIDHCGNIRENSTSIWIVYPNTVQEGQECLSTKFQAIFIPNGYNDGVFSIKISEEVSMYFKLLCVDEYQLIEL